jgi:hypothetical protein
MQEWFTNLSKTHEFARLCEVHELECMRDWHGIPEYPYDWRMVPIQAMRYISFGFIGFSVVATICNYVISCLQ